MLPKRQPFRPVVLHDLPALGHGRQRDGRPLGLGADHTVAFVSRCEQWHHFVRQALNRPERVTPVDAKRAEGVPIGQVLTRSDGVGTVRAAIAVICILQLYQDDAAKNGGESRIKNPGATSARSCA